MKNLELASPSEMSASARAGEITTILAAAIVRTLAGDDVDKAVLEAMLARRHGLRDTPQHHFDQAAIGIDDAFADQQLGLHDGASCHHRTGGSTCVYSGSALLLWRLQVQRDNKNPRIGF